MKTSKTQNKLFALNSKDLGYKFSFNAKDEQEAKSLMMNWVLYHGFSGTRESFSIEEIAAPKYEGENLDQQNRWVR